MVSILKHDDKTIPFVHHPLALIRYMEELDISTKDLLEDTYIGYDLTSGEHDFISYRQYAQLIRNAKELSKLPSLGLSFGEKLGFSAHGLIGIGLISSTSMYNALSLAVSYKRAISTVTHLEFNTDLVNNEAYIKIEPALDAGELLQFFQETLCSCFYYCGKVLNETNELPINFYFSYPEPVYVEEYKHFLNSNLYFNSNVTQMRCDRVLLDAPLPFSNPVTAKETRFFMHQQLSTLESREGLLTVIREHLKSPKDEFPSLKLLSKKLNTSVSTLKRKLKQHNTSYQEMLNLTKQELACRYILDRELSITSIAEKLDFAEPCSFRRAFKKWTGCTPTEYRKLYSAPQ